MELICIDKGNVEKIDFCSKEMPYANQIRKSRQMWYVVWQKSADFAIKSLETSKKYYDSAK